MGFKELLENRINIIDNALEEYMKYSPCPQSGIYEAMSYSLFAGGKRLRPVIMLLCAEMCGAKAEDVLPFACAIEMIHTYSLIHDDLPAMDNDDLRRGKPTNHIVYGEAMAILAGDALLNKAAETALLSRLGAETVLEIMRILFASSGTEGMIGGQVIDIKNASTREEELRNLHMLKTGAIIRSSGVVGAIAAGASEEECRAVDEFCKNLGIAFQIQDDILDVKGNEEELGKPVGSDKDNDKTTYVSLFGVEKSEKLVKEYTDKAIESLEKCFGEKSDNLKALAEYLIKRKL